MDDYIDNNFFYALIGSDRYDDKIDRLMLLDCVGMFLIRLLIILLHFLLSDADMAVVMYIFYIF